MKTYLIINIPPIYMNIFKDLNTPIVYQLPKPEKSIFEFKAAPEYSKYIDYPSFKLGFQHYIHANKDKFDILSQFEGKKKVYKVVDRFNVKIDDYDKDLYSVSKKITGSGQEQEFFKFWEILMSFKIVSNGDSVSIRNMTDSVDNCFKSFAKEMKYKIDVGNKKNTDVVCVSYEKADYDYRNTIEQDTFIYLLKEISAGINVLNKNGNMIIKINEMYTKTMCKVLCAVRDSFNDMYLYKPLTSPQEDSERFIVCLNKTNDKAAKLLEDVYKHASDKYVIGFCNDYEIDKQFASIIRKFNTDFANRQLMNVNKIVEFIDGENYYGETYQVYRNEQISSTDLWVNRFLPPADKKTVENDVAQLVKNFAERAEKVNSSLTSF